MVLLLLLIVNIKRRRRGSTSYKMTVDKIFAQDSYSKYIQENRKPTIDGR